MTQTVPTLRVLATEDMFSMTNSSNIAILKLRCVEVEAIRCSTKTQFSTSV